MSFSCVIPCFEACVLMVRASMGDGGRGRGEDQGRGAGRAAARGGGGAEEEGGN